MIDVFVYNGDRYASTRDADKSRRLIYMGAYDETYTTIKDLTEVVKACSLVTGVSITAVYLKQMRGVLEHHPLLQKDKEKDYA